MDSRKRPIPNRRAQSGPLQGAHRAPSRMTPEELAKTRVVPTARPSSSTPSNDYGQRTAPSQQRPYRQTPSVSGRSPSPRVGNHEGRPAQSPGRRNQRRPAWVGVLSVVGKALAFILTFIIVLLIVLSVSFKMICSNSNPAAQRLFVQTVLETGQLKFLANFASKADRMRIIEESKMEKMNDDVDTSLIDIPKGGQSSIDMSGGNSGTGEEKDVEIVDIAGSSYHATMMIVKDPSRVSVATIYPWREEGVTLDQIAKDSGALGAINGGIYNSYNNSGGMPFGVVVSGGEIQYNAPQDFEGLVLIGLTESNILEIIDINGYSPSDVERLVAEKHIRDAVTFQEESTDSNNHFVQLIINGEKRDLNGGTGSGLNPRTAIGQRADGAILMLVTDGRGKAGHLGASAADLIDIMSKYGAVNAANLDGGSSSCMYYNGDYLMTSVTFYYSNASWKLPLAFIFK